MKKLLLICLVLSMTGCTLEHAFKPGICIMDRADATLLRVKRVEQRGFWAINEYNKEVYILLEIYNVHNFPIVDESVCQKWGPK